LLFFFFQAEDGIRDDLVTGVQTCALPISAGKQDSMSKDATIGLVVPFAEDKVPDEGLQMYPGARFVPRGVGVRSLTPEGYAAARSEERRVGKEGRTRWGRGPEKTEEEEKS